MDLLTAEEEQIDDRTRTYRFDIPRSAASACRCHSVAERVGVIPASAGGVVRRQHGRSGCSDCRRRGSRPGSAGGLSRGRPDLAGPALEQVRTPTLLIVGGRDLEVLALNKAAAARLSGPVEIAVVPGATHLFEEPGALDRVVDLALDRLNRHLGRSPSASRDQPKAYAGSRGGEGSHATDARDIARLRNVKTRSISPENADGAKGGGGRATEGTGGPRGPRPRTRLEAVPVGDHRRGHHLSDSHDRRSRHDHPHLAHHPLRPLADVGTRAYWDHASSRLWRSCSGTSSPTAGASLLRSVPR